MQANSVPVQPLKRRAWLLLLLLQTSQPRPTSRFMPHADQAEMPALGASSVVVSAVVVVVVDLMLAHREQFYDGFYVSPSGAIL